MDTGSPGPCVFLSELMKSGQVLEKGEFLFLVAADKRTILSFFPPVPFPSCLLPLWQGSWLPSALPVPPQNPKPHNFVPAVPPFPRNPTEDAALGLTRLSLLPTLKGPGGATRGWGQAEGLGAGREWSWQRCPDPPNTPGREQAGKTAPKTNRVGGKKIPRVLPSLAVKLQTFSGLWGGDLLARPSLWQLQPSLNSPARKAGAEGGRIDGPPPQIWVSEPPRGVFAPLFNPFCPSLAAHRAQGVERSVQKAPSPSAC